MPQHCLFDRSRAFGFASIALLFLTPAMPLGAQTLHGTLRTTAQVGTHEQHGAVRVSVTSRSPGEAAPIPANGAEVVLIGSPRPQLTDTAGVATFAGLTTGDYKLEVNTLAYTLFSEKPETLTVHVEAGTVTRTVVETKSLRMLGFNRCRDTTQHIIAGAVYKDGAPVPAAHVTAYDSTLLGDTRISTVSTVVVHEGGVSVRIATASTNALGRFVMCVPHHFEPDVYELLVYSGNGLETSGLVHFTGFGGVQAIDLILRLPKEGKAPAR